MPLNAGADGRSDKVAFWMLGRGPGRRSDKVVPPGPCAISSLDLKTHHVLRVQAVTVRSASSFLKVQVLNLS
jgi:hypothetical protein